MRLRFGGALLVLLLVLLPAAAVWAQGSTGAIAGRVTDTTKQPIPGASVPITSKFLQGSKGTATSIDGNKTESVEVAVPFAPESIELICARPYLTVGETWPTAIRFLPAYASAVSSIIRVNVVLPETEAAQTWASSWSVVTLMLSPLPLR